MSSPAERAALTPGRPAWLGELGQLARLALPIAAAQGGQALMSLVDVAVVGRASTTEFAAMGQANSVFFAVAVIGMGLMMGLDPLASQALGAGDKPRARRLLWQGSYLALLTSAVLACALVGAPWVLRAMKLPPATAAIALVCVWIRVAALPFLLVFVSVRSYLQASGSTLPMVWAVVAANVFNLACDVALVFGVGPIPALGAAGSAISTSLATVLQLAIVGGALLLEEKVQLRPGDRRPSWADIGRAARVGLPIGLQMGAEVGVFALVSLLAGRLGDVAMGAHQTALSLASLSFCIAIGVGNAGSVRVGRAVGQGDTPGARRSGLVAFGAGATVMGCSGLLFLLFPELLARTLTTDPEIIRVAVPLIGVAGVFQLSDGIQGVGAGILRGAGDTRFAFVANVIGHYAVGLPIAVTLGLWRGGGVTGLWWGLCAGLTAVALSLFGRFWRLSSKPIARLEGDVPSH